MCAGGTVADHIKKDLYFSLCYLERSFLFNFVELKKEYAV